jgi:hypothetical protein
MIEKNLTNNVCPYKIVVRKAVINIFLTRHEKYKINLDCEIIKS